LKVPFVQLDGVARPRLLLASLAAPLQQPTWLTKEAVLMLKSLKPIARDPAGRVLVPALMWFAGVPLGAVVVIWFLFFRG
jgi:hypothetical protein